MKWFVVTSKPNAEPQALTGLLEQGYEAYLPVYRKFVRHANRTTVKHAPLFPGYLFVRLQLDPQGEGYKPWSPIRSTRGVQGLLATPGGTLLPLPTGLIEDMQERQRMGEGVFQLPAAKARADYAPGQNIRITEGPWQGYTAIFHTARDRDRITILLDILGGRFKVTIPESHAAAL